MIKIQNLRTSGKTVVKSSCTLEPYVQNLAIGRAAALHVYVQNLAIGKSCCRACAGGRRLGQGQRAGDGRAVQRPHTAHTCARQAVAEGRPARQCLPCSRRSRTGLSRRSHDLGWLRGGDAGLGRSRRWPGDALLQFNRKTKTLQTSMMVQRRRGKGLGNDQMDIDL